MTGMLDALPHAIPRARIVRPGLLPRRQSPPGERNPDSLTNPTCVAPLAEEVLRPASHDPEHTPRREFTQELVERRRARVMPEPVKHDRQRPPSDASAILRRAHVPKSEHPLPELLAGTRLRGPATIGRSVSRADELSRGVSDVRREPKPV